MAVPLTAIHCFTLFYTKQEIISEQSKNKKKQLYTHALSSLLLDIVRLYEHNLKHYNNLWLENNRNKMYYDTVVYLKTVYAYNRIWPWILTLTSQKLIVAL